MTRTERLVVAVAAVGFFFDAYELLSLPLIIGPAFRELLGAEVTPARFNQWVGYIFWIPAVCGGLCGLAGGYLADRFGRRQVLIWSVLFYAGASGAAAFSTSALMFLICRCVIVAGVCVEFVAGIAWLAEVFDNPARREKAIGLSQAVAGLGGLAATGVWLLIVRYGDALPSIAGGHTDWRYLCLSGLLPALPLLIVRPFMPESPMWLARTTTRERPRISALFTGTQRTATVAAIVASACTYALAYGAMQHLPRLTAALPEIATLAADGRSYAAGQMQAVQELGGLAGRLLLAGLVVWIAARRGLLRALQVGALVLFPFTFVWMSSLGFSALSLGVFIAAAVTAAQFSFWGSYLPRVFPTHLRATGESLAVNVGGRIIGTTAALVTTRLHTSWTPFYGDASALALAAAAVAASACVIGLVTSRFLVEPTSYRLPT